jgi:hypothetical protein
MVHERPPAINSKFCSICDTLIVDELKADPFFTGIYKCPACKMQKRIIPLSPPIQPTKLLPNIQIDQPSGKAASQHQHYFPSPLPTPIPSPIPYPESKNRLSFYIQQYQSVVDLQVKKPVPRPCPISTIKAQSFESFVMERYKRELENTDQRMDRSYITQYEICKLCHGLNTSGVVVTAKGDKICRKCFKASSITSKGTTVRVCNKCNTCHTSKWYTDRLSVGHICKSCYTKRRSTPTFDGIEGERRCTRCSENTSTLWYQDHFTSHGYMCFNCHDSCKKPRKS